jgi:hypothetical protein
MINSEENLNAVSTLALSRQFLDSESTEKLELQTGLHDRSEVFFLWTTSIVDICTGAHIIAN